MMASTTFDDEWTFVDRDAAGHYYCKAAAQADLSEDRKQQQIRRPGQWTEVMGKRSKAKQLQQQGAAAAPIPNSGSLYSALARRNRIRKDLANDDDFIVVPTF
eukprot:TRINITY_DN2545_c5_g1_i1.p2 TRINITY_DN2545_c5_g1~~TRINITY_DN2545_c5_g1_i1.p2  ORF type:complete len:103 (+),score=30.80 TRINITY_DN2545_c5_g1_i1:103-411(+)